MLIGLFLSIITSIIWILTIKKKQRPSNKKSEEPIPKTKKEELLDMIWYSLITHPSEWAEDTCHQRRCGYHTVFVNKVLNIVIHCAD